MIRLLLALLISAVLAGSVQAQTIRLNDEGVYLGTITGINCTGEAITCSKEMSTGRNTGSIEIISTAGTEGPQGPQGPAGSPGAQGPQGVKGDTGDAGPQGLQGTPGPQGNPGAPGADGSAGAAGAQGLQGVQGPPGNDGAPGAQGQQGIQGIQGIQGDTGPQGPEGPPGGGGSSWTTAEIDFGSTAQWNTSATITDAAITVNSKILVLQSGAAATGKQADENEMDTIVCNATPGTGSFALNCLSQGTITHGAFKVHYAAS